MSRRYPHPDPNPDFARLEESVLESWREQGTFRKSVERRPARTPDGKNNEFIFYDGPPFANGLPHYGHLLTGFVKDLFARYQTMRGKRVERRFGWDCHGLPAEMGSEKELGISGRQAIQNFGIGKFNDHCRESVMKYRHEWEYYVTRQARWVDFAGDYKTMDKDFMESVLWAFKQLYDKGLIYEAHRVMPYSWAAETPLSNFETKLDNSYREREEKAITVAFELKEKPRFIKENCKSYKVLAWTTTPWTLPSNLALAVGIDLTYRTYVKDNVCYIARDSFEFKKLFETEEASYVFQGEALLDLPYHPLFPYFDDQIRKKQNAFRILDGSDFVTDADGTGIVHMAPGFGEDDQKCCEENGIELVVPVDGQGKFTDEIYDLPGLQLRGLNVIAEPGGSRFGLANDRIVEFLKAKGALIKQEQILHNYPHCWRTDTPLIYRAMPSWYVEVTKFRDRAAELNKQINWIPGHVRDGQMGHMLATAPDWSISRNRFWGTPIPVWRRESLGSGVQGSEMRVFGSIAEMEEFFDLDACFPDSKLKTPHSITDLHRPFIDGLTVAKDGSRWKRVEDVFDCWFESGSMPFAQVHYPFANGEWFQEHFPADFITEYVGQTRGWFNTLIMLATALFDTIPFKNCICHGVVLDSETGLKYSKRLKNYKDPKEVMDKFGADALRWLMISSPVMRGQDLMVDPEGKFIRDVVRLAIKPVWNAYHFFCLYANADGVQARESWQAENLMDRYILAKCALAVEEMGRALDAYDTPSACEAMLGFFEVLNNWYIRRSKERFWSEVKADADPASPEGFAAASKQAAYDTLYTALSAMCRAGAPLLPLTTEEIYRGLTGEESVHLADWPAFPANAVDHGLIAQMDFVRDICNAALSIRNKLNIRVRQPLANMEIVSNADNIKDMGGEEWHHFLNIIAEEVNIKVVRFLGNEGDLQSFATLKLSLNNQILGKRLPEKMKQIIPAAKKGEWVQRPGGGVEICGESLLQGEFSLQLEPKPEYANRAAPLSTNDALVILDIKITPELEAEGIARDLVRMIQQARKDAGLHVADRIALSLAVPEALAAAVSAHEGYIAEQTLAVSLTLGAEALGAYRVENAIDEHKLVIALSKAV